MYYVYLIRSINNPQQRYVGYTVDIVQRLKQHNSGEVNSTFHDKPWQLVTCIAFSSASKAIAFEKYIKIGSGHAFAKKRLW